MMFHTSVRLAAALCATGVLLLGHAAPSLAVDSQTIGGSQSCVAEDNYCYDLTSSGDGYSTGPSGASADQPGGASGGQSGGTGDGPMCTGTCPADGSAEEDPGHSHSSTNSTQDGQPGDSNLSDQPTGSNEKDVQPGDPTSPDQPKDTEQQYQQCMQNASDGQTACQNRGNTICSVAGGYLGAKLGGPVGAATGGGYYGICDATYNGACNDGYKTDVASCASERDCLDAGGTDCSKTWWRISHGGSIVDPWPR